MIESVHFRNFKVLRDATLPLGKVTLIIGPNGSGKSTALEGFRAISSPGSFGFSSIASIGSSNSAEVAIKWGKPRIGVETKFWWNESGALGQDFAGPDGVKAKSELEIRKILNRIKVYSLDAKAIPLQVPLMPNDELQPDGGHLAGVLDRLRDKDEERFKALNDALGYWLPEFDRILFETPQSGFRAVALRTRTGHYTIPAKDLSQGTLLALAMLTLAYLPEPPSVVCLEEPDRGIHPRLLRQVQDVIYRLGYPESHGESREPVQVIATTHSPYLLDLFRDYLEEVVIAQKTEDGATFQRLSEQPYIEEILRDTPNLGGIWYTGILGGVPSHP